KTSRRSDHEGPVSVGGARGARTSQLEGHCRWRRRGKPSSIATLPFGRFAAGRAIPQWPRASKPGRGRTPRRAKRPRSREMHDLNRCPAWAVAGLAICLIATGAAADEPTAADVAGAVIENSDCVGAAIANQAIEEGMRRGGRRLLSRLGIASGRNAAPVPCERQADAAETPTPAPAAAEPAPQA